MFTRLTPLLTFCTQVVKGSKNSINPVGEHVAYGFYFPKEWTEDIIYTHIDPSRKNISHVQIMRSRIGVPTGKILFKFFNQKSMEKYIEKYNQDFILTKESTHRVVIKPFQLKTKQIVTTTTSKKTKNAVSVKNLDFDITAEQLQRLGKDYGTVEYVEMQVRPNGMNNGMAIIYFNKKKQAEDFSYFCHGLRYKQRKLTSQVIQQSNKQKQQFQYLNEPTITIQANTKLYKMMVAEQFSNKKQEKKV